MTDDKADRIRELNERISQWDSEHQHEIQQIRDTNQGLKETLQLSMRVAVFGSIPSMVWLGCWAVVNSVGEPVFLQILQVCGTLLIFGAILAGAARAGGLFAHWWFWRSIVNRRMATIVIALAIAAVLFGWVLFFFRWYDVLLSLL
jgi:hypothetical protein